MTERPVLGRDDELAEVRRFLGAVPSGPCALIVEGSAGIGKTTIWLEAVSAAREMGHRVLAARASESEARLSYAALGDLFAESKDDALADIPEPQRLALEAALLRSEAATAAPDQRAVSLATLAFVRALAASGPLVIAIDDVQWLDTSTARVLSFVLRRLAGEPVGIVHSLRIGSGSSGDPIATERAVAATHRLHVGPIHEDPLGRILRARTGADLPRPVVVRLHDVSDGNPLFALEIARAMVRRGIRPDPGAPLPVPDDLQQLLSARLAALPAPAGLPLLAIAASSNPTVELIHAVTPEAASREGLGEAEASGVVERADGRVRFSHPLLASTVYVNATARERRDVHRLLADAVGDPEERARHLALSFEGPDEQIAAALDEAARHARARGAPDAATDLAELARQRTPPNEVASRRRRSLIASEHHFDAGDAARAIGVLRDEIAELPAGNERAELLFRLSAMSWMNLVHGVREPAEQALDEIEGDDELRAGIHVTLAWVALYLGELAEASAHANEAAKFSGTASHPGIRADALATLGVMAFLEGTVSDHLMAEAVELQDRMMAEGSWTEASVYTTPRSILGLELMWAGRLDEARGLFERELAEYERVAMYTVRQEVLCYLAELECRAGRWHLAVELAAEAMETVVESGQTSTQSHVALFNQALPAAYLGEVEVARRLATEGVQLAIANDDLFNGSWNRAVLGFLELSLSNFEAAHAALEPAVAYLERMGSAEPGIIPCVPDDVEALVGLGRANEAEPLVDRLEERGRALDRPWALASAARCRGLISAARGDLDGATGELARALEQHDRGTQPFERARSMLVLGQIHRRRKQKRPAREALVEARDTFAELGAPLWERRAEAELARVGGRPPTPLELTATERDIAQLVAAGRTNKEVADALFMSPNTVQANLKRIYRKLGVRSRTELAAGVDRDAVDQKHPRG